MTASATRTATFTITDARYVGAKIGADLLILNSLYGSPSLARIDDYAEEAALLLRDGYLGTVDYGFRDAATNSWKLRLRYTATTGGRLLDSHSGGLPIGSAVAGYSFCSFLIYSTAFRTLTAQRQEAVLSALPFRRSGGDEPVTGLGNSQSGHGYGRNGAGVTRDVFTAFGIEAP
jgi:Bacterial HORMA domain family 1